MCCVVIRRSTHRDACADGPLGHILQVEKAIAHRLLLPKHFSGGGPGGRQKLPGSFATQRLPQLKQNLFACVQGPLHTNDLALFVIKGARERIRSLTVAPLLPYSSSMDAIKGCQQEQKKPYLGGQSPHLLVDDDGEQWKLLCAPSPDRPPPR